MADITMCKNEKCPLKYNCQRYKAAPNEYRQSYSEFKPKLNSVNKIVCSYFWEDGNEYPTRYVKFTPAQLEDIWRFSIHLPREFNPAYLEINPITQRLGNNIYSEKEIKDGHIFNYKDLVDK